MTKEKIKKECELCGNTYYSKATNSKYCPCCRKVATSKLKKEKRIQGKQNGIDEFHKHHNTKLDDLLAELRKYNAENDTALSYGQFMLMRERINA